MYKRQCGAYCIADTSITGRWTIMSWCMVYDYNGNPHVILVIEKRINNIICKARGEVMGRSWGGHGEPMGRSGGGNGEARGRQGGG